MRKLMMAVAGLGLMAGCKSNNVEEKRQDVAEAQRDAAKTNAEAQRDLNKDIAEARQDAAEKRADAQKDVQEEQRDLAEAQNDQLKDNDRDLRDQNLNDRNDATGGSGMANAKTEDVKGTIQSASGNTLKLIVPDKNNQVMQFQANSQVKVMKDDKPVALTDLKAGDEVRASYTLDANGKMVLQSIEVEKMSAQHPGAKKK